MGKNVHNILKHIWRAVVPVCIMSVVYYITVNILRYTILMQEQKGIFLATSDYFRQVFSSPWPITTLISDYLVQFYQNATAGALIISAIVTIVYGLVCLILRFTSLRPIIAALASAATWYVIAHANTPHKGVVILAFTSSAALISLCIPYAKIGLRGKLKARAWQIVLALAPVLIAAYSIASDRELKDNERWYAVEYLTRAHDWDLVLAIATPNVCKSDMSYLPYALLALNAKGQLGERLMDYPVTGPESLGENVELDWSGTSLRSQIYEVLGCTNEAIHMTFQLGAMMPHGTSFGVLRQLVRLEIESGNPDLVKKYASVLMRSPRNRTYAESALKATGTMIPSNVSTDSEASSSDALISNNSLYNLSAIITKCPSATASAKERLLCHLLISNDIEGFKLVLSEFYGDYDVNQLPRSFRQWAAK